MCWTTLYVWKCRLLLVFVLHACKLTGKKGRPIPYTSSDVAHCGRIIAATAAEDRQRWKTRELRTRCMSFLMHGGKLDVIHEIKPWVRNWLDWSWTVAVTQCGDHLHRLEPSTILIFPRHISRHLRFHKEQLETERLGVYIQFVAYCDSPNLKSGSSE